jgi:signal transduction histidine kinase
MKRTVIVVILAALALALLASVALESRTVPTQAHIAQYTLATETARIRDDFTTLVATLQSAWANTQAPGEGARALIARLSSSAGQLRPPVLLIPGNTSQRARVINSYEGFSITTAQASALAQDLLEEQAAYAENVGFLRDVGPQIIQQMRDIRLDRVAADTFQLIVGSVDFATPDSIVQENELRRLLVTLGRDQRIDANMPQEVQRLRGAVLAILDSKRNIRSKLEQLRETPVATSSTNLALAAQSAYGNTVTSAERARVMLALYAVVLFVSVGFIAFRLQHSYRDLNRANGELATLNESLEQRVVERTEELAGTLKDLKESQVQLVQAEKMSSLGQLVAGISHEINTPLLYLTNNAELIQERTEALADYLKATAAAFSLNPDDFDDRAEFQARFVGALKDLKHQLRDDELEASMEETQDLVRDSIEGLKDLTEMAQSLKDFSRLDRSPVGRFDVNAGLDKTLVIARNIVKHKAEVRKFYGEVPEIECSPSQINQVFLNLITNAAQAIAKQGEIVITTKRLDDDHVAIAVCDSGCGIPKENLQKIRDPFFTTKEVGSGTGLGLSIVDEIVRSHGGELRVESEVGRGSTFTVILPLKQSATAAQDATTTAEDTSDAQAEPLLEEVDLAEAV